jgi:hypothetical protein
LVGLVLDSVLVLDLLVIVLGVLSYFSLTGFGFGFGFSVGVGIGFGFGLD